jgi:hypothetical protein
MVTKIARAQEPYRGGIIEPISNYTITGILGKSEIIIKGTSKEEKREIYKIDDKILQIPVSELLNKEKFISEYDKFEKFTNPVGAGVLLIGNKDKSEPKEDDLILNVGCLNDDYISSKHAYLYVKKMKNKPDALYIHDVSKNGIRITINVDNENDVKSIIKSIKEELTIDMLEQNNEYKKTEDISNFLESKKVDNYIWNQWEKEEKKEKKSLIIYSRFSDILFDTKKNYDPNPDNMKIYILDHIKIFDFTSKERKVMMAIINFGELIKKPEMNYYKSYLGLAAK